MLWRRRRNYEEVEHEQGCTWRHRKADRRRVGGDLPDRGPYLHGAGGGTGVRGEPDAHRPGRLRVRYLDPHLPTCPDLRGVSGVAVKPGEPAPEEDRVVLRPSILLEWDLGDRFSRA